MKKSLLILLIINVILIVNLVFQMGRGNSEAQLQYIVDLYMTGEYHDSLEYIDYYLIENPEDHVGWTIKGNILLEIDSDSEAEEAYLIALDIEPYNFQAINALGVLARRAGDYEYARELYETALELQPDYAQALTSLAVIELKMTNDTEALRLAKLAYEKNASDPVIVANLAVAYHYNDQFENRDKYTDMARDMDYVAADSLTKIYTGQVSARD